MRFFYLKDGGHPPCWILKSSRFQRAIGWKEPICLISLNFMSFGRTITEISLFSSNEDGCRPPSWFLKVRIFQTESFLKGFASLCEISCREDKLWKVSSGWHENYTNYSNTTKNNILFIDRLIREAIWIRKTDNMNRDKGSYQLSVWDKLLHTDDRHWKSVLMKAPTWSRNVDKQYVIFGCIRVTNIERTTVADTWWLLDFSEWHLRFVVCTFGPPTDSIGSRLYRIWVF